MKNYVNFPPVFWGCSGGANFDKSREGEGVNPATSRPASTFFAISMFNSRDEPGPPVANFKPGSFCTSAYRTTFNGYLPVTSEENSARSTELLFDISIAQPPAT